MCLDKTTGGSAGGTLFPDVEGRKTMAQRQEGLGEAESVGWRVRNIVSLKRMGALKHFEE